jgi:hypothetical protein
MLYPGSEMSADTVSNLIQEFVQGAGLFGTGLNDTSTYSFSSHGFRRGGAQYRFMGAPVGERWTLAEIKAWGGWTGKNVRTVPIFLHY